MGVEVPSGQWLGDILSSSSSSLPPSAEQPGCFFIHKVNQSSLGFCFCNFNFTGLSLVWGDVTTLDHTLQSSRSMNRVQKSQSAGAVCPDSRSTDPKATGFLCLHAGCGPAGRLRGGLQAFLHVL